TTRIQGKQAASKSSSSFKIGFITDKALIQGCGCSFSLPNEMRKKSPRFVFGSNVDDVNKAWMNIGGKDVELSPIAMTHPKGRERVGSQSTQSYAGSGIQVSAVLLATRVCALYDEQCESTDYTGTFTVTKDGVKQTIRLKGT